MNPAPPSAPTRPVPALPTPMRRLAGLALLAAGIGFTGMLSFARVVMELFD